MTRVLTLLPALALLAPAAVAADPPAPAVILYGGKLSSLKIGAVNGEANVSLELTVGKDTPLEAVSKDMKAALALTDAIDKNAKESEKRSKELAKQVEEAAKAGDLKKVKELNEALLKEGDNVLFVPAVVSGALTYKDKRWQLVGGLRALEPDGKDKGIKPGACTVQGEATKGEYKVGDVKSSLAVRAGDLTVVLTGPAAKEAAKGRIRATGTLTLTRTGEAILEATKVEAVRK
jgi:hypothetical protein